MMKTMLLSLAFTASTGGLLFAGAVVPPVPRFAPGAIPEAEEKPKETEPENPDDPLATVERIAKTAAAIGDRLKERDTGKDTRAQQEQLLKDIDSLLKPPPPMPNDQGGGGGGGGGGGAGGQSSGGGGGGGRPPRGSGGGSGSKGEQGGSSGKPMPMPMGTGSEPKPMNGDQPGGGGKPKDDNPMGSGSGKPMGGNEAGNGGKSAPPGLPNEDPFTKQVWGHLPEKLRQQALQSYREQFMPRYGEMLKQYYSTLAEREKAKEKK